MRALLLTVALTGAALPAAAEESPIENPIDRLKDAAGGDPDMLVRLGDLYVEAKRLDEARKAYKLARWKKGENPESRFGIIKIAMAENKFQTSKHYCRKLEKQYPKVSTGDVCSGWFWLGNARSSRAIEAFESAIEKGDVARGKTGIAEAHRRMARWEEAITAYDEALAAGAGYLADLGLGLAKEKLGDASGAVAAVRRAAEREPASSAARYHLGRLLARGEAAVAELQTAVAIRPKWYEAYVTLGDIYAEEGKHAEASQAYKAAIAADGRRGDAHYGLATALYAEGRLDEALVSLQSVVDNIPNHANAYLLFAEIYYKKKEPDQAIEALDRARGVASGDVDVFVRSAEIYMELGRYTNARAFLSEVVSMKPRFSRAHVMLGDIACERQRSDEGRTHYDKALEGDMVGVDKAALAKKRAACSR